MKQHAKIIFPVFLLFIILAGSFHSFAESVSWSNSSGSILSVVGFNNYIKPGQYTQVQITLTGSYTSRAGTIELSVPTNEEDYYLYREHFFASSSDITVDFYVPTSHTVNRMSVAVLDEEERLIDSKALSYNTNYTDSRIFTGVLTQNYDSLDYWNQLRLSSTESREELRGYSQLLDASQIPTNYLGLDMLDMIMIDGFDGNQLSTKQWAAIHQWIFNGGILLIGSNTSNIQQHLPSELPEPEPLSLSMLSSILSRHYYGQGKVLTADFPLSQLSSYFYINTDTEEKLASTLFGEETLNRISQSQTSYSYDLEDLAVRQATQVQASQHLNLPLYIGILIIYIAVVLPFLYYILRKKDLLQYLRSFVTIAAIGFAGLIFLLGSSTRFSHPFLNYISIQEYNGTNKTEKVYMGVQAPYNQAYSVSLDKRYSVVPLQISPYWSINNHNLFKDPTVTIDYLSSDNLLTIRNLVAFTTRNFYLERTTLQSKDQYMTSSASFYDDKVSGTVVNHMDIDFNYAVLALPGHITKIGNFPKNSQISLENCDSHFGSSSFYYQDMDLSTLVKNSQLPEDPITVEKRVNLLSYYLQLCDANKESRGVLIGFTENSSTYQKDSSYAANGLTLTAVPISIDQTQGELSYFPALPAETSVLMGDFFLNTSPSQESEFGIINYQFNKNYIPEQLRLFFDAASTSAEMPYVSEIYFFKPATNVYVQIYPGQLVFSAQELKDFLDEKNQLLVKYRADPDKKGRLPRMTCIGRRTKDAGN